MITAQIRASMETTNEAVKSQRQQLSFQGKTNVNSTDYSLHGGTLSKHELAFRFKTIKQAEKAV